jgi:hypothetical protein
VKRTPRRIKPPQPGKQIAELQLAMMALGQATYRDPATEPDSNGDTESHTEDVIEGDYQEM